MIIFHRITCITALVLLCHLLCINFTIQPLPSQGFFTVCFTQVIAVLPYIIKLILLGSLFIMLLYSTFTLKLQGTAFLISIMLIELSLVLAEATLTLREETPFY